jgi:anti-sigma B factor antagonist
VSDEFSISVEDDTRRVVVTPRGDIDLTTAPDLHRALMDALLQGRSELVIDLDRVTYLDSCGIRELVHARVVAESLGTRIMLIHPNEMVLRTLELVGLKPWLTEAERSSAPPRTAPQ